MQPYDTNILQQNSVCSHLLDIASCKANHQQPPIPGCAFHGLGDKANRVVYDVYASAFWCEFFYLLGPVGVAVRDGVVGAKGTRDVELVLCAGCGDDGCAEGFGDLDSG
jgi:hypothetical protein